MANQLNTSRSSVGPWANRPAWRCKAIKAKPLAPPTINALTHNTPKYGHSTDKPKPKEAMSTAKRMGTCKPCRSANRPAGKAKNTWDTANKASKHPTAKGL
jgi:hypothetical protein